MTKKEKTPMPFETHEIFARHLYTMREMLPGMLLKTVEHYGATGRAARQLMHMCTALGCARFELDNQFQKEYPDRYDFKIYYPWCEKPPRHNVRAERKRNRLAKSSPADRASRKSGHDRLCQRPIRSS